jgi:hypothetical protein
MAIFSIRLQKDVEKNLTQLGVNLRSLDVLVIDGNVNLTGNFSLLDSNQPFNETDIERIKGSLYRIPGINSISCRPVEKHVYA